MVSKVTLIGIVALGLAYFLGRNFIPVKVPGKIVTTKSGRVQGIVSKSRDGQEFYEWRGIPFGKVPVRFATALPADPWQDTRDATEYGPICIQLDFFGEKVEGEEDCLFLNIFIPKAAVDSGKLLPTFLFLHGGAFGKGSSSQQRPDYFMDHPVAFVTINYRLGLFGFLNSGDENSRGNMGLKDQSLAMKWVKDNIKLFGGDPDKITVYGQSAGSASAHLHLFSNMSKGLISQVICQSGVVLNPWAVYRDPVGQAQNLARNVHCPTENSQEMVECLRSRPASELLFALGEFLGPRSTGNDIFIPTIEAVDDQEAFLVAHPRELLEAGNFTRIPMMVGATTEEGLAFGRHYLTDESYREYMHNEWLVYLDRAAFILPHEMKHAQKIRDFYFGPETRLDVFTPENFKNTTDFLSDNGFLRGTVEAAQLQSKYSTVYLYSYEKPGHSMFDLLNTMMKDLPAVIKYCMFKINSYLRRFGFGFTEYGVTHGDDLIPLFYMPQLFYISQSDPEYQFSKDLVKLWVDFAYDHKSIKFRGEAFPPIQPTVGPDLNGLKVLQIADKPSFREYSEHVQKRLNFWNSLQ